MKAMLPSLFVAALVAANFPLPAQAQTRKPAPKAAAKPAAKPVVRPATAPKAAPTPAAAPPKPAAPAAPAATANDGNALFGEGTNALNLGIGLGNPYSYGAGIFGGSYSSIPALSLSFERGIKQLGPGIVGVGVMAGYTGSTYSYGNFEDRYTDVLVMVRGTYHYSFIPQLDTYAGVGIGMRRVGYSSNYNGPLAADYGSTGAASGIFVGGRYFFTDNIGAFAELGYDHSYLKVGLTAKF